MTKVIGEYDDRGVSLMAVDQYLRQVRWSAPVSSEEETMLLERIQRGKEERTRICPDARVLEEAQAACDRLLERFQRLVIFLAKKWLSRFRSMELPDLIQEGNVALLRMIEQYDLREADNMGALAAGCIRHAFGSLLYARDHLIRFPENQVSGVWKLRRVSASLLHRLGREPQVCELAQVMQVSESQVLELLRVEQRMQVESLPLLSVGDEAASEEPANIRPLYPVEASDGARQRDAETIVWHGMNGMLTEWQLEVVLRYHGLEDYAPQTFKEIASTFGVSKTAVRLAYAQALRKLKRFLARAYGELSGQVLEGYYTAEQAAAKLEMPQPTFWHYVKREGIACTPVVAGSRVRVYAQGEIDALAARRAQVAAQYYTSGQAVEQLGVAETTLRRWVAQGVIERATFEQVPGFFYARAEVDALAVSRQAASGESGVA